MKSIRNSVVLLILSMFLSAPSFGQTCNSSFEFTRAGAQKVAIAAAAGHNINELYDATNGFTWEAWVYMADTSNQQTIFIGVEDAVICQDIFIGTGWNGPLSKSHPSFIVRDNAGCGGTVLHTTATMQPATWYYVTGVCDYVGGTITLYLDGTSIGSAAMTLTPGQRLSRNITTSLGNFNSVSTCSFNGNIDEVKFWTGLRTPTDILADSVGCTTFPQTGLVAYFKANEGAGTAAASFVNSDFSGTNSAGWGANAPVSICKVTATITSGSVVVCDTTTDSIAITISISNLPPGSAWSLTMSDGTILSGTADAAGNATASYNVLPAVNTSYTIASVSGYPCAELIGTMDVTFISCCVCEMRIDGAHSTTNNLAGMINGSFHLDAGSKKVKSVQISTPYFYYDFNAAPWCQVDCKEFMTAYSLSNFINPLPLAGAPPVFGGCFGKPFAREVDWNWTPGVIVNNIINYTLTIPHTQCHMDYDYCVKVLVQYTDCTICECTLCFRGDVLVCSCENRPKGKEAPTASAINEESVNVYPNPNGGQFTVSMERTSGSKVISVVDMTGRIVTKSIVEGDIATFDISNVAPGTYNVIITGGGNVVTRRVVISK